MKGDVYHYEHQGRKGKETVTVNMRREVERVIDIEARAKFRRSRAEFYLPWLAWERF
jgi:hypothetical protein